MDVFWLSGHLLSRYIVHLGLKNTPGLIFEVPGPQNPIKKMILIVFSKIRGRFSGRAAGQVWTICWEMFADFPSCQIFSGAVFDFLPFYSTRSIAQTCPAARPEKRRRIFEKTLKTNFFTGF